MKIQFELELNFKDWFKWGLSKIPFFNRNHLKLKLFAVTLLVLIGFCTGLALSEPYVFRNLTIAYIAQRRAGDANITYQPEYTEEEIIADYIMWGNVPDILTKTRLILPYLVYEKIVPDPGNYPSAVLIVPNEGSDSFHKVGQYQPAKNVVTLNERLFYSVRWNDEANVLSILTHELIHAQGGSFLSGMSEELESATQAGTLEVLAGMCNYSDPVACRAFWKEIEDYGRTAARIRLYELGLDWLSEWIGDVFFRDDFEDRAAEKSLRFWADDPERLDYILRAYALRPWEEHIIPGVVKYKELDTGNVQWLAATGTAGSAYGYNTVQYGVVLGMPFDDTREMLGWLWWFMVPSDMEFPKSPGG